MEQEPTVIFPIGTTIEDDNGIYKIERFQKDRTNAHLYYCEVLKWKIEVPAFLTSRQDPKNIWIWIRHQNQDKIKVIE